MTPKPPALDTAAANGPEDVRAMPASTIGYSMPRRSHSGVRRVGLLDMLSDTFMVVP